MVSIPTGSVMRAHLVMRTGIGRNPHPGVSFNYNEKAIYYKQGILLDYKT